MTGRIELERPWLVAVWPGMGNVAINAGYYLMAKLGMHLERALDARELFEIGHVDVEKGIIRPAPLPRSRFFAWRDPGGQRDLLLFLGEAQPPAGIHAYCERIVDHARELGVTRVLTFAAMATQMPLNQESRVFAAATAKPPLEECRHLKLEVLSEARISGLNGVLPGVAAEHGLEGTCLLGEMPQVLAQVPYPKASLAVLRAFNALAGLDVDLGDLERETQAVGKQLEVLQRRIEEAVRQQQGGEAEFGEPAEEQEGSARLAPDEIDRLEQMFEEAAHDRARAYALKRELDRLKVFPEYEDRFLDLFKDAGAEGADPGGAGS